MSKNIFPNEMIIDKELNNEELELLVSQYRKVLNLGEEKMDDNQYQLFLDKNRNVYFPKGTLIHGTSSSLEVLKSISEKGILACEFIGKEEDNETYYCADFHRVDKDMLVSTYDSNFVPDGKTPFNKMNKNIGLIVNPTSKIGGLLYYDLLDSKFDNNNVRNIINASGIPRDFLGKNRGKASAILAGIPSNCISGIVIGDKLVLDNDFIKEIQRLFPNAYLITRRGEIIKDRTNTITIDDYEEVALKNAQSTIRDKILVDENKRLENENNKLNMEFTKYIEAVKNNVPPIMQAKILLSFGYQSIPIGLIDLLTEEEKNELGIKKKSAKK